MHCNGEIISARLVAALVDKLTHWRPVCIDSGLDDEDDLGAAGGMPGDLTGSAAAPAGIDSIGEGADTVTADDHNAHGPGDADVTPRKRQRHAEDLAPAGHNETAGPLMAPGDVS